MRSRASLPILLLVSLAACAQAITIRDDVSDAASQALAAAGAYASVGEFTRSDGDITSGVLINSQYVLSAAHIVQGFAGNAFTFTIGGSNYATVAYTVDPQNDLVIFHLAQPVLNVTPALLYTGTLEGGKTATIVGFGLNGNGTGGSSAGTGLRGTERAATNVIDAIDSANHLIEYDFDSGSSGDNVYGSTTQTADEGLIALGDSGGGTFATFGAQTLLIGIHSGVSPDLSSKYGYVGADVRVSAASSFIQSVVPEPGSIGLGLFGLLAFGLRRRRRA